MILWGDWFETVHHSILARVFVDCCNVYSLYLVWKYGGDHHSREYSCDSGAYRDY